MTSMRLGLLHGLLLCCSWHSLRLAAADTPDDQIIGSIDTVELHQSELQDTLGKLDSVEKEALARDPAALMQLVRSMLVQRVVLQKALEKKWDQEPAVIPLLQSAREATLTDSYLKSICKPPATYPTEVELQAAYEASRAALTVPRSYRMAQIYIATPENADKAATAKASSRLEHVRKQLQQPGASFAQIARELSEEKESASRDGEIGWLNERQIQPEILAQLPKLRLQVVSAPIQLKDGWHILKVLDVREPFTPIFDQVRAQLAQRLRAEKTRANTQSYLSELLHDHPVAVNQVALSKLLLAVPTATAPKQP